MQTSNLIRKISLAILASFIFQTSFCQENYIPGYVISKGDTLRGYVDYRNWAGNPDKIAFKENLSDKASIYTPLDIKGFGVLDEIYESAIIQTEVSPKNIDNITDEIYYNADLVLESDTTFLQTIIQGKKSLYYYMNRIGKDQFYIRQDSSYQFLIYKEYLITSEGHHGTAERKQYLNQLTSYLMACPGIQSKIRSTTYSRKSMENLFRYYYAGTRSTLQFQKKTEKVLVEYGVFAGLSLTSVKFNLFPYLEFADFNTSKNFSGGLFLELFPPRNQRRWSLCNELIYSSYEANGIYKDYTSEYRYNLYYTTIGFSYLKMNNMVRYKYPIGDFFVYLNAGISNGFAISETNNLRKENYLYSSQNVQEIKALESTRKYEQGYIIGLGARHKKCSFELRYERGNGMSDASRLQSAISRYFFLLGYQF